MNALDLIKEDHENVNHLLQLLEQTKTANEEKITDPTLMELLKKIKGTLQLHEQMEESIFYPALMNKEKDLIKEAYMEHDLVDQLMADLEKESATDQEWMSKFTIFKEMIQHHVEEEESEIFEKAQNLLNEKKLEELGEQMENFKLKKSKAN